MRLGTFPIHKIEHRDQIAKSYKKKNSDNQEEIIVEKEDLGWWVVSGNFSFFVGNEKPDFKEGDLVVISVEKMP